MKLFYDLRVGSLKPCAAGIVEGMLKKMGVGHPFGGNVAAGIGNDGICHGYLQS
jgi:hypothetical protein